MALDQDKIVAYGPYTVTFRKLSGSPLAETTIDDGGSPATNAVFSGLKFDSVSFSLTTKEANVEFEDGSEVFWEEGRTLEVEINISEMDTAMMDKIETATGLLFNFSETGKSITVASVSSGATTIVSVDNFKTKITYRKIFGANTTIANCLTIA